MKVVIPATNVAELLSRRAARQGERVALVDGDRRITWSKLEELVDDLSRGMTGQGLVGGQRVAIALENSLELVVTYLATLRGGMVAVPLKPGCATGDLARMLADSGARWCFADASTIRSVRGAVGGIADACAGGGDDLPASVVIPKTAVIGSPALPGEAAFDGLLRATGPRVSTPLDSEALAVLLYPAGTSDRPGAVMLTHRALLANIDQAARVKPPMVRRDDVVLGVVPLSHLFGLNAVLGQVLLYGATLVLARRFEVDETLRLIEAEQVTCVPVSPPVLAAWRRVPDARARLASVRTLLSGAGPLSAEQVQAFEAATGLKVEQGYELPEAAPVVTSTVGSVRVKPGSVGRAVPGVGLRVVDPAGRDAAVGDPGEISVRGANLLSGYWPTGEGGPGEGGWFATGDVGFLDSDGELYLVDRLTEIVIVSGFNVYPSEIEEVICEVPGVAECAVIGVPDGATGEAVVALVVAAAASDADLEEVVKEHCQRRLARFKVPTSVRVMAELPHSATGAADKQRLRDLEARRVLGLA